MGVPTSSFPVLIQLCRAGSRFRCGSSGGWKGVTKFIQFFSQTLSSGLLRASSGSPPWSAHDGGVPAEWGEDHFSLLLSGE